MHERIQSSEGMRQMEKHKDQYFQTAIKLDIFYIGGQIIFLEDVRSTFGG